MEVSMSVIINLTEHTNEFYTVHFCNFFCRLPLHSTYVCLTFFCLITWAFVYSIIIWPTNWRLLSCGTLCWDCIIFCFHSCPYENFKSHSPHIGEWDDGFSEKEEEEEESWRWRQWWRRWRRWGGLSGSWSTGYCYWDSYRWVLNTSVDKELKF